VRGQCEAGGCNEGGWWQTTEKKKEEGLQGREKGRQWILMAGRLLC